MNRTSAPAAVVPPSVVILGSDALLAALPATPTQLANACYAAAYEGVFPASWGDELVSAGCLKDLETRMGPAILCACPLVAEQLRGVAPLARFQLHLVSPPVAAARYLRALCDDAPLHITYVGDCPGAEDATIDERIAPAEFLRRLGEKGITPLSQRPDLGANVPRDRRRFYSLPGGAPTPEWLSADWPQRTLVESDAGAALADLAHNALARENTLIDFAPQLGCACSGAVGGIAPSEARRAVAALEPPRARQEVLDPDLKIAVRALVPAVRPSREVSWDEFLASLPVTIAPAVAQDDAPRPAAVEPANREPAPVPSAPPPRTRPTPIPVTRAIGAALTNIRTTQPVPRRPPLLVEGSSGPRFMPVPKPTLSASDRWMLVALVLGASVASSALTAFLMVRGLSERVEAGGTTTASPPVRDSVVAVERRDSTPAPPVVPVPAVAPPLGDQRTLALADKRPAPAPLTVTPLKGTAAMPVTRAGASRAPGGTTVSTPRSKPPAKAVAPPPPPAPPIFVHVAPESPPVAAAPAPAAPVDSTPAAAVAVPVAAPVPAPAPAAATTAPPVDAAAEMKAIRDELNARKKRVDSLTKSLDSLRTVSPPR